MATSEKLKKRQHTVARFLIDRFARDTPRGRRVCQLDVGTGQPQQISPRNATVRKHFYTIDIDEGRTTVVEDTLGLVEDAAAPHVRALADGEFPIGRARAELALFVAMSHLRTPHWREETKSLTEQVETAWGAERLRYRDAASLRESVVGTEWEALSDSELQQMRDELVAELETGQAGVEMPVNNLIKLFLHAMTHLGWIVFALDWTLVHARDKHFVVGDTPTSLNDATPPYPGSGAGVASSPNAQLFLPLDPTFGILTQPNADKLPELYDAAEVVRELSDDDQVKLMGPLEGRWAEELASPDFVDELNLRTYTHAQRYIYGSQQDVCDVRRYARSNAARRAALTPAPPRIHILEDDPSRPGVMKAWKIFEPKKSSAKK